MIDVLQMNSSGLWIGALHDRIGHFKFINVEVLNERVPRRITDLPATAKISHHKYRQKPGSVQELLQRLNLQVHTYYIQLVLCSLLLYLTSSSNYY